MIEEIMQTLIETFENVTLNKISMEYDEDLQEDGIFLQFCGCEFCPHGFIYDFKIVFLTHSMQKKPDFQHIEKTLYFFQEHKQIEKLAPNKIIFNHLDFKGRKGSLYAYVASFKLEVGKK